MHRWDHFVLEYEKLTNKLKINHFCIIIVNVISHTKTKLKHFTKEIIFVFDILQISIKWI